MDFISSCESMLKSIHLPCLVVFLTALASASEKLLIERQKLGLINALGLKNVPNILPDDREKIQIPESIKELYTQQTGKEIDTTHFQLPGQFVGMVSHKMSIITIFGHMSAFYAKISSM